MAAHITFAPLIVEYCGAGQSSLAAMRGQLSFKAEASGDLERSAGPFADLV